MLPVLEAERPASICAPNATLLTSGLQGPIGITGRPGSRTVCRRRGGGQDLAGRSEHRRNNLIASRLPKRLAGFGFGGPVDVAFIGNTAYVLVSGRYSCGVGDSIDGIYRVDGPNTFTVVADLGAWSFAHPPKTGAEIPTGVHYALHTYRGGFPVSDANHNRVLFVTLDHCANFDPTNTSNITELITFLEDTIRRPG
jgi:hypothetical protein